jgi:hypothetical protein
VSTNKEKRDGVAITKGMLICGIILTPLFFGVVLIQAFTRQGFDITRTPLSLLSLGDFGWIQAANFVAAGILAIVCAIGVRRTLIDGLGGTWGPLLIGLHGLGLVVAGLFHPDPALGFPPGIAAPIQMSFHSLIHQLGFVLANLPLLVVSFVFSRRFFSQGQNSWGIYSIVSPLAVFALLVASFSTRFFGLNMVAGILNFGFVAMVSLKLHRELNKESR